jgi:hypothetical protein
VVNAVVNVAPCDKGPESQLGLSLLVVCCTGSVLIQVTDCPLATVTAAGLNANWAMVASVVLASGGRWCRRCHLSTWSGLRRRGNGGSLGDNLA